jgi:hypothetical protein
VGEYNVEGLLRRIASYADRQAEIDDKPAWTIIRDILYCDKSKATDVCHQFFGEFGWKKVTADEPAKYLLVDTVEDLGDAPRALERRGKKKEDNWFDVCLAKIQYQPKWWRSR